MAKRVVVFLTVFVLILCAGVPQAQAETQQNGVDIMIICAHPGDEFLFLGGALPLYVGEQMRSAVVVYLSSEDEAQREDAKKSLSVYGDRVQTVFGSFSPVYTSLEEDALKYWDIHEVTSYLVTVIRQYKPTIVLTHDKSGEYGHGAHCVAFDAAYQAVPFAGEAGRYPESTASFGAWQVPRFFAHLYGETQVTLDRSKQLINYAGKTALELDQECYQSYTKTYPIKITDADSYTCARYGLVFPAGDTTFDPAAGDLFAGLDPATLYPTASPSATQQPTPEPTAEVQQAQPAVKAAQTLQEPPAVPEMQTTLSPLLIAGAALGALALAAFAFAIFSKKDKKFKRAFFITGGALLLCAAAVIFLSLRQGKAAAPETQKTAEALSAQTPAPAEAAATPEPAATATPDPWAQYFRSESDPEEVVISDPENEHWEYRSDQLSVIIDRVHVTRADGKPVCYCVANIRMRGEDAFRAGVRNDNPLSQPGLEHAWHMARRYRAVLGIAGDNLIQAEVQTKGILMRNGKIYSVNKGQDTLAFMPNDLTMQIFKPGTVTPQQLLDMGVLNTFSFGPTMLNNGVKDLKSKRGNLGKQNPRTGIGMVEPGHFVAITVDGRQKDYSVGMTMPEFTQLFYLYGCQIAHNLDGGSTTAMIFMGECINQHSGVGSDVQRPWTDGLFWGNSELVPTVDDPVYNDGSRPWKMPPQE